MAVIQQNTPWLYTPIQPIFNYCYIWTMGNTNVAHKPISCVMRYSTYLEKQNRNWTNFSPPGDINNDAPKRGKWACGSSCKHNICWHNNSRHWVRNDNHIKTRALLQCSEVVLRLSSMFGTKYLSGSSLTSRTHSRILFTVSIHNHSLTVRGTCSITCIHES